MAITGKIRIAAAMRLQPLDRVPVMCQLALGHYFLNTPIPAIEIWHSTEGFGEALITLQQKYSFDGILVNLPGRDPQWRSYVNRLEDKGNEKIIHWKNGWHTVCPASDNPHSFREDGKEYHSSFGEIDPEKLFYIEPHDLGGLKYPFAWGCSRDCPQNQDFFPPWHFDTIKYVVRHSGQAVSVHGEIFSPFSQFLDCWVALQPSSPCSRTRGKARLAWKPWPGARSHWVAVWRFTVSMPSSSHPRLPAPALFLRSTTGISSCLMRGA